MLLGKLRHEKPHAFEILGIQDAAKNLLEVVDRQHLALGHVAEVGARRQINGRREFREEVFGQIEIQVEALDRRGSSFTSTCGNTIPPTS